MVNRSLTYPLYPFPLYVLLDQTYHMIDRCDSSIAGWSEAGGKWRFRPTPGLIHSINSMMYKQHLEMIINRPH